MGNEGNKSERLNWPFADGGRIAPGTGYVPFDNSAVYKGGTPNEHSADYGDNGKDKVVLSVEKNSLINVGLGCQPLTDNELARIFGYNPKNLQHNPKNLQQKE